VVDAPEVEDEGVGEPVDVEVCVDPVVGAGSCEVPEEAGGSSA